MKPSDSNNINVNEALIGEIIKIDAQYDTMNMNPEEKKKRDEELEDFRKSKLSLRSLVSTSLKNNEIPKFLLDQEIDTFDCYRFFECVFCCKCKKDRKKTTKIITLNDLSIYKEFLVNINTRYDRNLIQHEESLRFLYLNSLQCDLTEDLKNDKWMDIGFNVSKILLNFILLIIID